ncbi:MAG: energy-coupling factor ABC transporter ATP-binding protein [Syntrophobacterales bacterium]|nr:energy-coupling factor ABC transporter ATP-binding protein [Syntrophobacterales bacterium]
MSEPIIRVENLTFRYPGAPRPVFQDFTFELLPEQHLGLVGPNGAGKTTLLHLLMGLLKPQHGRILIFGRQVSTEKDFAWVRQRVGLLFQNPDDQLFCPTVLEDVAFGPLNQGKTTAEAVALARETMAKLGLEGFEERITYKLSGGEKKLVALATVLAMEPELLLLDEPTAGLDEATKHRLAHILKELTIPYMIVSHERDFLNETVKKCCHVHTHCCQPE